MVIDAPINIDSAARDPCRGLCSLSFNYADSVCNVKKYDENSLSVNYDSSVDKDKYYVRYKGIKYTPVEIKIYNKSLHKYDGVRTQSEMIVKHNGDGGDGAGKMLYISVPIIVGNASTVGGSAMDTMLQAIPPSEDIRSSSSSSFIRVNFDGGDMFNLNTLIPSQRPFYTYMGNDLYADSGQIVNYVVFTKSSPIGVSAEAIKNLQAITTPYWYPPGTPSNTTTYNSVGANSSNNKDLFIDCSPAGDDGVILYQQGIDAGGNTSKQADVGGAITDTNILESKIFLMVIQFIVAAFLAFIIVYVAYMLYKAFSGTKVAPVQVAAGPNPPAAAVTGTGTGTGNGKPVTSIKSSSVKSSSVKSSSVNKT